MRFPRPPRAALILAVLGATAGIAACGGGQNLESLGPPDEVAIEIGGQKITNAEIDRRALLLATQPTQQGEATPPPDKGSDDFQTTRRTAAEQLRDEKAFGILAARCGKPCRVTKAEITMQIQQLIDAPVTAGGFNKDEKAFEKALQDRGITRADLTLTFTANQQEQRLTAQAEDAVKVTDAQARAFYDTNIAQYKLAADTRLSHILLESQSGATTVRAEATPENFEELARTRSKDPSAATTGGDLGTIPNTGLLPELTAAAASLKPGVVSAPVKSTFGWHILLVRDIAARTRGFAEVKDEIVVQELQVKQAAAVQKWRDTVLKKLQDAAVFKNSRVAPEAASASTAGTSSPPTATSRPETVSTETTSTGPATP